MGICASAENTVQDKTNVNSEFEANKQQNEVEQLLVQSYQVLEGVQQLESQPPSGDRDARLKELREKAAAIYEEWKGRTKTLKETTEKMETITGAIHRISTGEAPNGGDDDDGSDNKWLEEAMTSVGEAIDNRFKARNVAFRPGRLFDAVKSTLSAFTKAPLVGNLFAVALSVFAIYEEKSARQGVQGVA